MLIGNLNLHATKLFTIKLILAPDNSKIIDPALKRMAKLENLPLPLPILTPIGFENIGTVSEPLTHIFDLCLVILFIICFEASICFEFKIPDSIAFKPIKPNPKEFELYSNFFSLPFLVFLKPLYIIIKKKNNAMFLILAGNFTLAHYSKKNGKIDSANLQKNGKIDSANL